MRAAISGSTLIIALTCCPCLAWQGSSQADGIWDRHHLVVLSGLPGDAEHKATFRSLVNDVVSSLSERGMPRENTLVLDHDPPADSEIVRPATRESITSAFQALQERLTTEDALWLVFIGHADYDGENARFHIPGPDLRAIDYADLLRGIRCREQVIWLTMSSSGWFLEPLSKEHRVIVTSTLKDSEPNETEFPAAMVEALGLPNAEVDDNQDETVSVLELFAKIHQLVTARYRLDQRAATEHAMIDDNGDGRGTEWDEILKLRERITKSGNGASSNLDGKLSAEIRVGRTQAAKSETDEVEAEADFEIN